MYDAPISLAMTFWGNARSSGCNEKAKSSSTSHWFAVSFRRAADQLGLTRSSTRMTSDLVADFQPDVITCCSLRYDRRHIPKNFREQL